MWAVRDGDALVWGVCIRERPCWSSRVAIMEYDPLAPVPRYRQIAAILREWIGAGELEADRSIPSEARIQQKFGVARETARKGGGSSARRRLGVTVLGLGTYVRKR